jgi:hypothetical protein
VLLFAAGFTLAAGLACRPAPSTGLTAADDDGARVARETALTQARVWFPPSAPIDQVDLGSNPVVEGGFADDAEIECRFVLREAGGTTPKFYCQLPDGQEVKIKYGAGNAELPAEVAASRLLAALGFGADRMFVVRRVRCAGCPTFPFQSLRCYERFGLQSACFAGGIDYDRTVDFDAAVIERKLAGRVIEAFEDQGWAWYELAKIDPARGGSPRAEVDAFYLMAIFLAHWDNKAPNQRLICPPGSEHPDGTCGQPIAIMQDLGATFGPLKIDLHNWRSGRIWKDGASCTVSMEHLPWHGATFPERQISEEGRQMLLGLLEQLRDEQLRALFEGSRVTSHDQLTGEARRADAWVRTFKDRVDQIRKGGPCPS